MRGGPDAGRGRPPVIVVDSNVIAYLYLPERERTTAAQRVLARDPTWAAPALWRSEVRNVLALYARQSRITLAEATTAQRRAEALLAGREYGVDSAQVLALAAESGRSAYDCEFVAVAQALGVRLVSNDRQLVASFPEVAISLDDFAGA